MSFNPPRNVPSFSTDRNAEDNYWQQKQQSEDMSSSKASSSYAYPHARGASNGQIKTNSIASGQIKEKLGEFLGSGSNNELPLYKDKPRFPSKQSRIPRFLTLRSKHRKWLLLVMGLFVAWWFFSSIVAWLGVQVVNWDTRRYIVKLAFMRSWDDYTKYAWGKDEYSPISKKSRFMAGNNVGAGWIIVDGLDTAILMDCTDRVAQARKWIHTSLNFGKIDDGINTFETTIRVLGGLLSAQYLSTKFPHLASQRDDDRGQKGEDLYIEKAVDLADRLLGAFDSPTGIPYASVNLNTSRPEGAGVSSTAEAATLQLELKYLSKITGEPHYWTVAERVMEAIDAPRMEGGLLPIFISPDSGEFSGSNVRLGSRGDSYYEYLIKQYLQTGETIYKEMWDEALEGIKRYMITWSSRTDFTVLAERPDGLEGALSGKMDHLTCFLPGTIALSVTGGLTVSQAKKKMGDAWGRKQEEDLVLAEELMKTCWGMYVFTPTGLAAEITYLKIDDPPRRWNFDDNTWSQPRSSANFDDLKSADYKKKNAPWRSDYEVEPNDVHNLQRPETVESLYYMYRITENPIYREWGWRMWQSFQEYTQVVDSYGKVTGYTSLDSVFRIPPKHLDTVIAGSNVATQVSGLTDFKRDNMEGFWLSETLKYFYLLFSEDIADEWFDLTKVVFNTEAHIFPRFDLSGQSVFKTGWTRKEKPA